MDRATTFRNTAYFGSLDGLRALSILPVVWHHATPGPLDGVLGRGPLGVDLFFSISGFLITTLLLREREQRGTIRLNSFYIRRSLRIFPLYYLVLGAFALHAWLIRDNGPVRDHFLSALPWYATYTSNWFVEQRVTHAVVFSFAWSLATEEQFYLGFPWVLRVSRSLIPAGLFMVIVVLLDQSAERGWLDASPLALRVLRSLATPIALGSLGALALRTPAFGLLDRTLGNRWAPAILLGLVFAGAVEGWPLLPVQMLMAAVVISACLRQDHVLAHFFEARALRHIGVVSYGIYLTNVSCIQLAKRIVANEFVFPVGLLLSIALATALHRAIERPLVALRDRFR